MTISSCKKNSGIFCRKTNLFLKKTDLLARKNDKFGRKKEHVGGANRCFFSRGDNVQERRESVSFSMKNGRKRPLFRRFGSKKERKNTSRWLGKGRVDNAINLKMKRLTQTGHRIIYIYKSLYLGFLREEKQAKSDITQ